MKFCFNCGTRLLEENQKFCIKCGTKLKDEDSDLESGNADSRSQITNYSDYFDNAVDDDFSDYLDNAADDDLIKSESRGNVSILLNAVDMESNTFLKVEEGFDDNDMDKVFNHLKTMAHSHDEYRRRLIYEENKMREDYKEMEEYYSYDPNEEWQRILDAEEAEDREPVWVLDFKNVPRHPFAVNEISTDGNFVLKSAIGTDEHDQWLKRKREREEWKKTAREYEEEREGE